MILMMNNYWDYAYRYGGPGTLVGWLVLIALVIFIIWALASFIRWIARQDDEPHSARFDHSRRMETMSDRNKNSALGILEERYARGEISKDEFDEKKKTILR